MTVKLLDSAGNVLKRVVASKPFDLRRTPFDGLTVGAYSYVYSSNTSRVRTDTTTEEQITQTLEPTLVSGTSRLRIAELKFKDPLTGASYIDLNDTGRRWTVPSPSVVKQYIVKTVLQDTLVCAEYTGGVQSTTTVEIAKPEKLRRKAYDGKTIDSITYTFTDNTTRSATDGSSTETQVVTPKYLTERDIIYAIGVGNDIGVLTEVETGSDPVTVTLIDLNLDARAWMKTSG
jgi:hypothetical protein